jgi:hypothetical protein
VLFVINFVTSLVFSYIGILFLKCKTFNWEVRN